MNYNLSPIKAEIDLQAFRQNLSEAAALIGPEVKIIAVVKGDAYGHGAGVIAPEALKGGAHYLAVARLNEAISIRESGIGAPLILFGLSSPEYAGTYIDKNIIVSVNSPDSAGELSEAAVKLGGALKVHVKADTGMGRLGITGAAEKTAEMIKRMSQMPGLQIEGVYSHFANADRKDKTHALYQLEDFLKIRNLLSGFFEDSPLYHIANSAALMEIPESHLDMVRPGIMLYGIYPSAEMDRERVRLYPVMSIKSRIVQVKKVFPGFTVSYGSTYTAERETLIATVAAGYADGYSRLLSSRGSMIVNGERAPIIGRVCMDLTMLDISHIPRAAAGQEVTLIGSDAGASVTAEEVADLTGTIGYEVVSGITSRVPRVYINS